MLLEAGCAQNPGDGAVGRRCCESGIPAAGPGRQQHPCRAASPRAALPRELVALGRRSGFPLHGATRLGTKPVLLFWPGVSSVPINQLMAWNIAQNFSFIT